MSKLNLNPYFPYKRVKLTDQDFLEDNEKSYITAEPNKGL